MTESFTNDETRNLIVLRAGAYLFGVDAGDVAPGGDAGIIVAASPVPLPGAPDAVRGVVQVRGKLYTVIDPARMLALHNRAQDETTPDRAAPRRILPLRGAEQLALAVEAVVGALRVAAENIAPLAATLPAVRGVVHRDNEQEIFVLDIAGLFAAATHGMERRRRRS